MDGKEIQVTDTILLIYSWVFNAPQSLASPAAAQLAQSLIQEYEREQIGKED